MPHNEGSSDIPVEMFRKMQCTSALLIDGFLRHCQRKIGDGHWESKDAYPAMHEAKIPNPDGKSGLIVRWGTYRVVRPTPTPRGEGHGD